MRKRKSENDPSPNKYTKTEILGQVGLGNMDPKEAGITRDLPIVGTGDTVAPDKIDHRGPIPIIGASQDDGASSLEVLPKAPPKRFYGPQVEFQASVVPIALRAEWEAQEAKIVPFDKEAWVEANKNTFRVQGLVACGNGVMRLDQTFTDPVLGQCELMRRAADQLQQAYEQDLKQQKNEQTESAQPR